MASAKTSHLHLSSPAGAGATGLLAAVCARRTQLEVLQFSWGNHGNIWGNCGNIGENYGKRLDDVGKPQEKMEKLSANEWENLSFFHGFWGSALDKAQGESPSWDRIGFYKPHIRYSMLSQYISILLHRIPDSKSSHFRSATCVFFLVSHIPII